MNNLQYFWQQLPRPVRIAAIVLLDIALIGGGLCLFALFHHVIPRENVSLGVMSSRESAQTAETPAPAQPEAAPVEAENTPEPVETAPADPVGYFGNKFADKFTDGEVIQKLQDDGTAIYQSANLNLTGTTHHAYDSDYYVIDIYLRDIASLQNAFANGKYGTGQREWPVKIAQANDAIVAINGDYYGARDEGTVLRNGELFRDDLFGDAGVLYWDGTFESLNEMEYNIDAIMARGAYQIWNFGPMLLDDGQPMTDFNSSVPDKNPRTAFGYYEPGHYCFVVVDGRSSRSDGMSLTELSQLMYDLGCAEAYNLDGGETSQMVWDGNLINNPYDDGRKCSDIIIIREP